MTQSTATPLPFSSAKRRTLQADFSGGVLTSDAGVLLLREADRRLGLLDALDHALPDPRDPDLIAHPQRCLLAQRIFGIACGYEDLNDHQRLRDDPLWQTAVDHPGPDDAPQLASPPTLCRLENRVRRADLVKMAAALVECFIASHATPPEELILDFDATDDPVHGQQENRFFHGYYDGYCFLPLYVTCGDQLLVAYLRPSNIDGALHSQAILKLLVQRLRQVWPEVRIVVRADSGFCRWRLMRWCDRHGVDYLLGLAKNAVLQRQAAAWQEQAEQAFRADADGQAHRVFGEFRYAAGSWDRQRRVIAKAEYLPGDKANPRFIVTSLSGAAQTLYEETYCQRGDMENRIKEQQRGLFADRTSCHRFVANQFRVLLAAAAYVLVSHIRRIGLAGTEWARAEVGTIRLRLFKVGAWVQRSVRRVVVRMASSYPWPELFAGVVRRLAEPGVGAAAGP
jgi:hypothetical protein